VPLRTVVYALATVAAQDDVGQLHREIEFLRARVVQREEALARLTNRLVKLERGQVDGEMEPRALEAERRADVALAELERMRATKTFRWTSTARAVWRRALSVRARLLRR
jgi:predicted  nucleic acid-binding Zn-ribbon protein